MAKNNWLKITIVSNPLLLDPLSDYLVGIVGAGVEMAAVDEPGHGKLHCYIDDLNPGQQRIDGVVAQVQGHLAELDTIFGLEEKSSLSWELIEEQDWGSDWKIHFKPFEIVPGLVIVPTWEDYSPGVDQSVITMDPGMAFGTGHHPTTSLSLECIRRIVRDSGIRTLLDVGTGTGILAMAGLIFGAGEALAIDNDSEAVRAAKQNVRFNGLHGRLEVSGAPLDSLTDSYDLVVANIVHDVLAGLADELVKRVAKNGSLVLSGILAGEQLDSIRTIFTAKGLSVAGEELCEEWAAIHFVAPGRAES